MPNADISFSCGMPGHWSKRLPIQLRRWILKNQAKSETSTGYRLPVVSPIDGLHVTILSGSETSSQPPSQKQRISLEHLHNPITKTTNIIKTSSQTPITKTTNIIRTSEMHCCKFRNSDKNLMQQILLAIFPLIWLSYSGTTTWYNSKQEDY